MSEVDPLTGIRICHLISVSTQLSTDVDKLGLSHRAEGCSAGEMVPQPLYLRKQSPGGR